MTQIVDDVLDLLLDTITCTPGTVDETGLFVPSGTVLNLPCRIRYGQRTIRRSDGQEVVSTTRVIVGGYNDLTTDGHRYTLPARFSPRTDLVAIRVDKVSDDEDVECYEKVWLP